MLWRDFRGRSSVEQFVFAGREDSELFKLVDTTAKGPEIDLPDEYSFQDKNGAVRSKVRAKWWRENAKSWRDVAISVPDISMLPDGDIPEGTSLELYAKEAVPVFFGHYWLDGDVALQAPNALCLDYSAGTTGPLATYVFEKGDLTIRQSDVKLHSK